MYYHSQGRQQMVKKRFIAGAVCPSCSASDTLMLLIESKGSQTVECVECGYKASEPESKPAAPELDEGMIGLFKP